MKPNIVTESDPSFLLSSNPLRGNVDDKCDEQHPHQEGRTTLISTEFPAKTRAFVGPKPHDRAHEPPKHEEQVQEM